MSGRRIFLKQAAAAIPALAVPSLAGADSTGKFSSKVCARLCRAAPRTCVGHGGYKSTDCAAALAPQRTAKNRYVPRIKKGIAAFEQVLVRCGDVGMCEGRNGVVGPRWRALCGFQRGWEGERECQWEQSGSERESESVCVCVRACVRGCLTRMCPQPCVAGACSWRVEEMARPSRRHWMI